MMASITMLVIYGVTFFCFYFSSDRKATIDDEIKQEYKEYNIDKPE